MASADFSHEVWIDRGGTFTDFVALDRRTGKLETLKLPSSDRAPVEGIRRLLGVSAGAPVPACDVRLGTTLATNALLERRGVRSALAITQGFGDLLAIGDQTRPDLFSLAIDRPAPLPELMLEVEARATNDGMPLERPDPAQLLDELRAIRGRGIASLAVAVLNDHREGVLEREIAELARTAGFEHVALSSELTPELGLLGRAETAALDAYLTPPLSRALAVLAVELPGSRLRVMQSSGTLTEPRALRGPAALLSGPAAGVVACARLAEHAGLGKVVSFDMGGTWTDVSRSDAGSIELEHEASIGGYRMRAPVTAVTTIAAGGGSLCRLDGGKLSVGPESAGAVPGPLCYGSPLATELTLSDVNLCLGRLVAQHFPLPLEQGRALRALEGLSTALGASGGQLSPLEVAEGFVEVANHAMAQAIREISVGHGHDVREHALLVLGGAGGQHACAIARLLGVRSVVFHPLGGVLSAWGLGLADVGWHGTREIDRPLDAAALILAKRQLDELGTAGEAIVRDQVGGSGRLLVEPTLSLRYAGTETQIACELAELEDLALSFNERHAALFGHARPDHPVELVNVRVSVTARRELGSLHPPLEPEGGAPKSTRLFWQGSWLDEVPVRTRAQLRTGERYRGPLVVLERNGTLVIDPGFTVELDERGLLLARPSNVAALGPSPGGALTFRTRGGGTSREPDPVLLEVLGRRFMSIAEQMGHVLRRTALSTNIRERRDFSCAVFDRAGNLIANAPHIPVHLGAMGESVQSVLEAHPAPDPGNVFVTNDPAAGGSHLPDITTVAPVHDPAGSLRFFVACRGHHADVGGKAPGSMPADSTHIDDEGAVFRALRAVHAGRLDESAVLDVLRRGPYPARRPGDNLADLAAQIAAMKLGCDRLGELGATAGFALVERYMAHLLDDAATRVERWLAALGAFSGSFEDSLDDGTRIRVHIRCEGKRLSVDFAGTSAEVPGNANAPRAVTTAAVLYCLRALIAAPIPLNSGCLRDVVLLIPDRSLLAPSASAAVASGNVETSQRIVDVMLAAFGRAAASQGTMNNLTFGDASFGYYETIGGGAGAGPDHDGASAVQTHMTNTRLTDPEVLERHYPVRVRSVAIRRGSGGAGQRRGGDGMCRELVFLAPLRVSVISERRTTAPFGLAGGLPGASGRNVLNGRELPGRFSVAVKPGDVLRIETPGGGGFGSPISERPEGRKGEQGTGRH